MDSAVATTHTHDEGEHVSLPQHRHHFETEEQQREAGSFGMWLFLLTEIMFFGGLFFSYLLYRNWYYDAFVVGSNQLSIPLGGTNTAVLITSGFCMALAVWAAEVRKKQMLVWCLILNDPIRHRVYRHQAVSKWHDEKWEQRHIPGEHFDIAEFINPPINKAYRPALKEKPLAPDMAQKTQVYFFLYFAMTGMHALHMLIGLGLLAWLGSQKTPMARIFLGYVAPI